MTENQQLLDELVAPSRALRRTDPEPWRAFRDLHGAALADGALPGRVKELMALAISVVQRCDGCIAHHAKLAARKGATADEVAEALAVALLMGGGPATVYAPRAWGAFEEFAGLAGDDAVAAAAS
jgi:AhpD family alkylhydroperoxidase